MEKETQHFGFLALDPDPTGKISITPEFELLKTYF